MFFSFLFWCLNMCQKWEIFWAQVIINNNFIEIECWTLAEHWGIVGCIRCTYGGAACRGSPCKTAIQRLGISTGQMRGVLRAIIPLAVARQTTTKMAPALSGAQTRPVTWLHTDYGNEGGLSRTVQWKTPLKSSMAWWIHLLHTDCL